MVERIIKGHIEKWGEIKAGFKKDNVTSYAKISLRIVGQNDWFSFFSEDGTPILLNKLQSDAPVGSEVEFFQWQKEGDKYWNFKKGTFKVHVVGNGTAPQPTQEQINQQADQLANTQSIQPTNQITPQNYRGNSGVDWDGKERRTIRQNSGRHASAYITVLQAEGHFKDKNPNEVENVFFKFAEHFENWVYREKNASVDGFASATDGDSIKEEVVNQEGN